jgi:hypothetical protein
VSKLENSIVLITSTDTHEAHFGSGFVVYQDDCATYFLTCAHVIADVGGRDKVKVGKFQSTVVAEGVSNGCDLAVLRVEKALVNSLPLKICSSAKQGQDFIIAGFYQPPGIRTRTMRRISGNLGDEVIIEFEGDRTSAWDLMIDGDGKHYLESGYSGSPVVDAENGCVIGVAAIAQEGGKQGIAIAVGEIATIWEDMPESLKLEILQAKKATSELRVAQIERDIADIEQQLQSDVEPDLKPVLNWLSDQADLARKASDYALKNSLELKASIEKIPDSGSRVTAKEDFTWELEKYLELIYYSLLTGSSDLLDEPVVSPSQSMAAYESAFAFIKQRIPPSTAIEVVVRIKSYLDYLIQRLS